MDLVAAAAGACATHMSLRGPAAAGGRGPERKHASLTERLLDDLERAYESVRCTGLGATAS